MTRDEAKEFYIKGTEFEPIYKTMENWIDKIYDDFEKEKQELINKYSELSNKYSDLADKYTELKLKGKE